MRWVIGWAMVGRAEFAYLIAQMAAASNMMTKDVFAIVIWALLWATVFAPFLFRFFLTRFVEAKRKEMREKHGEDYHDPDEEEDEHDAEFRQSGHLPLMHEIQKDFKKEKYYSGPEAGYTYI